MKNILMLMLRIISSLLLLSLIVKAIPVGDQRNPMNVKSLLTMDDNIVYFAKPADASSSESHIQDQSNVESNVMSISSLVEPDGAKHGPQTAADGSSSGGVTHQPSSPSAASNPLSTPPSPRNSAQTHRLPATIRDSHPKSPRLESSHPPGGSNPSVDPSSPISGPTTHDPAHDENLLLKAVELEKEALDVKPTSATKVENLENLMIQSFRLRAEAIKAKARMGKKVTAELVQYHIIKIRDVIVVGLGMGRPIAVTAIEKNVGPEAQRIVNNLMTTLTKSIEYYSEDAPRVDEIVWPLPKTDSLLQNSETLIKEAKDTMGDLEKLPGEVQREVDVCVDYQDLLALAKMRQVNALAQKDTQKKEALLLVSFKIRCRAMKNKARVDATLESSWFDAEVDNIRLRLKDANSDDLGVRTQNIIKELWDTLQTQKRMVHKKRNKAPQVWAQWIQQYDPRQRNRSGQSSQSTHGNGK